MVTDKILIVDDEETLCEVLKLNLENEGYEVKVASDGSEGLAFFKMYEPDLVLLDIMLPGADGYEVLDYIKPLEIPVIFLTAKGTVEDRVKGLKLGADDYLTKPYERAELLARVKSIIRRSSGLAESVIRIGKMFIDINKKNVSICFRGNSFNELYTTYRKNQRVL